MNQRQSFNVRIIFSNSRLILTGAGHQFKLYAEKMIKLSEEAITIVNAEEEPTGTLIIGAGESVHLSSASNS
jgi:DNA-binding transcriptional LysR family regulator